jgi:hypothetical protein
MTAFDFEVHEDDLRLRVRPIGRPRIDSKPGEIQLVSHDLYVEATRLEGERFRPEFGVVTVGISPLFQIGGNREGVLDVSPDRTADLSADPTSTDPAEPEADCPKTPWLGSEKNPEIGFTGLMPFDTGLIDSFTRVEFGNGGDFDRDPRSGRYVPVEPGTGPYRKGYFHETAGLAILDDGMFDAGGNLLSPFPGLVSSKTIRLPDTDRRVQVTRIDLDVLGQSGLWPANGLLYAARFDSRRDAPHGILLANGRELAAPLTVVSESPVYVRGDYNVVERKGAAVIADRLHLLSEGGSSEEAGAADRARSTTVVASLVSGKAPSRAPRAECRFWDLVQLHEDWSGRDLLIRGSCACLYPSRTASRSEPGGPDPVGRPDLRLEFDRENLHVDLLPPFTPLAMWIRRWTPRNPDPAPPS